MPWENITQYNGTTLVDLFSYNNDITNDMFGVSLLLIIFMVMYFPMSARRPDLALTMSLFITGIISFLMVGLGLVNIMVAVGVMVAFAGSFVIYMKGGSYGV